MPFEKGKSGNPGGRPKENSELKDLARSYTQEAVEKLAGWMRSDNPKASVTASTALLDRGWGKATQPIGNDEAGAFEVIQRIERIITDPEDQNS